MKKVEAKKNYAKMGWMWAGFSILTIFLYAFISSRMLSTTNGPINNFNYLILGFYGFSIITIITSSYYFTMASKNDKYNLIFTSVSGILGLYLLISMIWTLAWR